MTENGRVVLLANAGVALIYKNTRIIIDGLFKDLRDYFTDLPAEVWRLMEAGRGDLANVDYLLFTHGHFDHYYGPYLRAYMAHNKVGGILLPPLDETEDLAAAYKSYGELNLPWQQGEMVLRDDIRLRVIEIRHVDKLYHHIPVLCLLFTLGSTHILFLSDADFQQEAYEQLRDVDIDYLFITPIFYNNPAGRRIIKDVLKVKKIVIYHLPALEDDKFMYYKMVNRDIEKYANKDEVITWSRFGQYISF